MRSPRPNAAPPPHLVQTGLATQFLANRTVLRRGLGMSQKYRGAKHITPATRPVLGAGVGRFLRVETD